MTDSTPEEIEHDLKQIASEESRLQQDLFDKWASTMRHKNGVEALQEFAERLLIFVKDLTESQTTIRKAQTIMNGESNESLDENKMLRDLTGNYVWIFKISEAICAHAGEQLYHLVENDELRRRICEFQKKPVVEN